MPVTDDKRDGDELFEDLDKFFAPIRDVDWDEPEESAAQAPHEEHVEVLPSETVVEPEPEPEPEHGEPEHEDEGAWYDTGRIEPVEGEVTVLEEAEDSEGEEGEGEEAQGGLFVGEDEEAWPAAYEEPAEPAEDAHTVVLEGPVGDEEEEAAASAEAPSDEDLEAAAEHFAGSIRDQEVSYATEPIDVFGEETRAGGDQLLDQDEYGYEPSEVEEDILADLREPETAPRTVVVGAEGISGPSWQDVSTVEVGADVERRGPNVGERDVPAAFMTGVLLAGVALAALWIGAFAFAVVATDAVLVAQGELFGVMVKHHRQPATAVGLVAGLLMMTGAYFRGESAAPAMFAVGLGASFLWYMTIPAMQRKDVMQNIGLTVLNMAWIPLLGGYLVATLKLPNGIALVVALVGLTFLFDTSAFLVGSVWGGSFFQRSLAPSVSPKKSIEGVIGGALVTVVVSVALVPNFVDVFAARRVDALLLGAVVAVAATLGDLAESLVKRDLGIKDMGSVLPGHGGVLDRIDSLLFVAPAAFLLFRVIFF
ncbi:MAG: phosphatidate cytidylyltransferase [Actinomycetota bacterium]